MRAAQSTSCPISSDNGRPSTHQARRRPHLSPVLDTMYPTNGSLNPSHTRAKKMMKLTYAAFSCNHTRMSTRGAAGAAQTWAVSSRNTVA